MRIPTRAQCYRLINEMRMLDHIVAHSLQVCRVAVFLTDHLRIPDTTLNLNLVQAAALLHDITKTKSFQTRENHALSGAQMLCELGYPEVGHIIGQHVRLDEYFASQTPAEAEIVNYADKRVLHDKVVSLSERMNYILQKYGKDPENQQRIHWLWERTEELEARLFSFLAISPGEFDRRLETGKCADDYGDYCKACGRI